MPGAPFRTLPPGYVLLGDRAVSVRDAPRAIPRFATDYVPPLPTSEYWLNRLMECPSWKGRRLSPEEELSLWVAAELRRLTRSGSLRAVWSRLPAEIRRGGRLASMQQTLGRVMGVVKGAPDFWFMSSRMGGCIELKVEIAQTDMLDRKKRRTYLRPEQKDFREWCVGLGVKHAVCRSVPEVTESLREWGLLL